MPEERQARAEARQIDDGGDTGKAGKRRWRRSRGANVEAQTNGANSNAVQNGPQGRRETNAVGVRVGRTPEARKWYKQRRTVVAVGGKPQWQWDIKQVSGSSGA